MNVMEAGTLAANGLDRKLRGKRYYISTAVMPNHDNPDSPLLVVYLKYKPKRHSIPSTFEGYTVKPIVTGEVRKISKK